MMDDDDWQEMPVVREASSSSSSSGEETGSSMNRGMTNRKKKEKSNRYTVTQSYRRAELNRSPPSKSNNANFTTNATGTHLDIDDARGYNWRAKPQGLGEAGGYGEAKSVSKEKVKGSKGKVKRKDKVSESSESSSDGDEEDDEGGARGYTQLRLDDDVEAEEIGAATDYLFTGGNSKAALEDGDAPTATPHSQLNTTKNLLSEGQKIAYVGLVSLVAKNIIRTLQRVPGKELQAAIGSTEEWRLRVMARLFQHMDIESGEQKMIESLAHHGVLPTDLSPSLITTQTVDNPDFDPQAEKERDEEEERERLEAKEQEESDLRNGRSHTEDKDDAESTVNEHLQGGEESTLSDEERTEVDDGDLGDISSIKSNLTKPTDSESTPTLSYNGFAKDDDDDEGDISTALDTPKVEKSQAMVAEEGKQILTDPNTATRMEIKEETKVTPMGLTSESQAIDTLPSALEGVTTELSSADKTITLDLRWTVLCDLFLVLTADSVYDSRSRVLLEAVAGELGLHWMDVTKFEKRVTDALEIEEGVGGSLKGKKAVKRQAEAARRRRMVMMGLATVGGGLVIGLSAGLMAPLIGAGLGAALGTIGIGGTTGFLGGIGGAAIITTTGTVGGAALGGSGMSRRTRTVKTFEFKPIHNNKRVNCIVTVGGFMNGPQDDPRLPFSVIDSIMGDVFGILWEPDMMQEMGNAIYLLWNETLVQGVQQVLAATIASGLVGALAWPLWLTKLGWFIDNPWSNALDRAHSCGLILADVLIKRKLGVRPITLVGFSLGARVIFYALVELAKQKKFGIIQNVYLIGAPVTASDKTWKEARGVVAGRFVNAFSRTDWILGWLFRATTGGLRSIAGLHPVERVPEVENVDVTRTVPGHLQYRAFMPLVLDELGFRTTADYFDEPEDLNMIPEREVRYDEAQYDPKNGPRAKGFVNLWNQRKMQAGAGVATTEKKEQSAEYEYDEDLPPRQEEVPAEQQGKEEKQLPTEVTLHQDIIESKVESSRVPTPATPASPLEMDEMAKILAELRENGIEVKELKSSLPPLPIEAKKTTAIKENIVPAIEIPAQARPKVFTTRQPSTGPPSSASSRRGSENVDDSEGGGGFGSQESKPPSLSAYPRKFSSTIFDADELPPAAPQARDDHGEVSLSFSESYEDEEEGVDSSIGDTTLNQSNTRKGSSAGSSEAGLGVFDSSAKQYGLSNETARELARQFQSSGMSSQGASAAAKLAQNFSEMSQESSLPSTSGRRVSLDADPWSSQQNLTAPPPQTFSMGRMKSEQDNVLKSASSKPPTSEATGWSNENPWG